MISSFNMLGDSHTAPGGTHAGYAGGCRPDDPRAVDWIFGSPGVRFSGYTEDRSPLVQRTTDHR